MKLEKAVLFAAYLLKLLLRCETQCQEGLCCCTQTGTFSAETLTGALNLLQTLQITDRLFVLMLLNHQDSDYCHPSMLALALHALLTSWAGRVTLHRFTYEYLA